MIYYPNNFISIGASNALIALAKDINLKNVELSSKNLIEINYKCRKLLSNLPEFKDWHYEKLSSFIWAIYRKDQSENTLIEINTKNYWIYSQVLKLKNGMNSIIMV